LVDEVTVLVGEAVALARCCDDAKGGDGGNVVVTVGGGGGGRCRLEMVGVGTVLALMRRGVAVSIEVVLLSGLRYLVGVCASYGLLNSCAVLRAGEMGSVPSSTKDSEAGVA
jgi:hypothetical protein